MGNVHEEAPTSRCFGTIMHIDKRANIHALDFHGKQRLWLLAIFTARLSAPRASIGGRREGVLT
jgi:hypothetical protein